jgi:uncharacterized protein YfaT (DUF1175 family)
VLGVKRDCSALLRLPAAEKLKLHWGAIFRLVMRESA